MSSARLYVGNLNYDTTEDSLKDLFAQYGEVVSVNIIGRKGFGFVEMASAEQAEKAKTALNQKEIDGRTIRVDEAKPREQKERGSFNRDGGGGGGFRRRDF
ncbi:MAG TPA: RNA-binding protein [bacterium]|nr:RNA-binding protein [bacterium]